MLTKAILTCALLSGAVASPAPRSRPETSAVYTLDIHLYNGGFYSVDVDLDGVAVETGNKEPADAVILRGASDWDLLEKCSFTGPTDSEIPMSRLANFVFIPTWEDGSPRAIEIANVKCAA